MSDQRHELVHNLGTAAAKSSWPVGVTLWAWLGQNLPTAVALATLVYIVLQTSHLLWIWQRERWQRRIADDDRDDEG